MNWHEMQEEHRRWLAERYPSQPAWVAAHGFLGEAGELHHALLQADKQRLFGPNARHPFPEADARDAVGDCCVYLLSWCNSEDVGVGAGHLFSGLKTVLPEKKGVLEASADLVGAAVAFTRHPDQLHARVVVEVLGAVATRLDYDLLAIARSAWEQVKGRAA